MVRRILPAVLILLLAGFAALYWYMRPLPILTVTTWPGDYGHAQQVAQMHPFAAADRVDVHIAEWEGRLTDLKGDVIDFELPRVVEACERGMLEKIDAATLPPGEDGTPAAQDFLPGALGPCWVGSAVYSQIIVFAPNAFTNGAPATLADFFDTAKFPGKRLLKRGSPKYNLEMALLADGVAPDNVYIQLSTEEGLERALAKLSSLGPNLAWYDRNSDALDAVKSGSAAFATALNGALYDPKAPVRLGVIWDRQLYEFDAFAIPAGNPRKEMAWDYIRFATGSRPAADVAARYPVGPARRSAFALLDKNPENGADLRPILPTGHFDTAFPVDDGWWRAHGEDMDRAWRNFLAGAH